MTSLARVRRAVRYRGVLLEVQDLLCSAPPGPRRRRFHTCHACVDDGRAGVELGLRHLMAGRVLPGLAHVGRLSLSASPPSGCPSTFRILRLVGSNGSVTTTPPAIAAVALVGHRQRVADRSRRPRRPCPPEPWRPSRGAGSCSHYRHRGAVVIRARPGARHASAVLTDGRAGV